jgi:hypothetical protein
VLQLKDSKLRQADGCPLPDNISAFQLADIKVAAGGNGARLLALDLMLGAAMAAGVVLRLVYDYGAAESPLLQAR